MKSSVRFKSLHFLRKKSIDLNRDWNQRFKSHWFKSANPDTMSYTCDGLYENQGKKKWKKHGIFFRKKIAKSMTYIHGCMAYNRLNDFIHNYAT